jgi:hypothetical protein
MRIIDPIAERPIDVAQIYLTPKEAIRNKQKLEFLLHDPEASEHFHIASEGGRDLSFSIVTALKLASGGYTQLEQQVLTDMRDA